jgi:hypothetical protein
MPARRFLPLLALLVSTGAVLSACDFAGTDGATGRWVGTAEFEADTILADHNARIVAAYETEFTFRLTDDEGLVTGQLTVLTTGYRIVHEAGQPADTLHFDDEAPVVHDVFGTYVDPTLEVDVPGGPYEEDLWTFEVSGRRAVTDRSLVHIHQIPLANGAPFEFNLESGEVFEMRRVADEE